MSYLHSYRSNFYPRPPGGGRPKAADAASRRKTHFYPRPPGGGRPQELPADKSRAFFISIHALRVEGDLNRVLQRSGGPYDFYPRPPGGGRPERATHFCCYPRFLSTPSGWRATSVKSGSSSCEIFLSTPSGWRATFVHIKFLRSFYSISIHALRVEGDPEVGHIVKTIGISIHALRVEGDRVSPKHATCEHLFLSTPSGWRATTRISCVVTALF